SWIMRSVSPIVSSAWRSVPSGLRRRPFSVAPKADFRNATRRSELGSFKYGVTVRYWGAGVGVGGVGERGDPRAGGGGVGGDPRTAVCLSDARSKSDLDHQGELEASLGCCGRLRRERNR